MMSKNSTKNAFSARTSTENKQGRRCLLRCGNQVDTSVITYTERKLELTTDVLSVATWSVPTAISCTVIKRKWEDIDMI